MKNTFDAIYRQHKELKARFQTAKAANDKCIFAGNNLTRLFSSLIDKFLIKRLNSVHINYSYINSFFL